MKYQKISFRAVSLAAVWEFDVELYQVLFHDICRKCVHCSISMNTCILKYPLHVKDHTFQKYIWRCMSIDKKNIFYMLHCVGFAVCSISTVPYCNSLSWFQITPWQSAWKREGEGILISGNKPCLHFKILNKLWG